MPGPLRPIWPITLFVIFLPALAACGESEPSSGEPDGGLAPDANSACPDPSAVLPTNYRPINAVADGALTVLGAGAIEVDATAGGFMTAGDNPFIYLSFSGGEVAKVAITDTESYQSASWDIALKRTVVRANGGDSGPGGVAVGEVTAASLGVASAPAESAYAVDDFATDDCELNAGQIGEPLTAFAAWYEYDQETNQVSPAELVFFVKRAEHHIKLRILDYYRGGDSARYEIEWAIVD
jgi:hypothetical protein